MSAAHRDAFERIHIEHQAVVRLLTDQEKDARRQPSPHKDPSTGEPLYVSEVYEAAVATANDTYALLLIATAEGFMRSYIGSLGIDDGRDATLNTLIDRCQKEFNRRTATLHIGAAAASAVHTLREQRNSYAHGRGSGVFPSVGRVAGILGRFFAGIP